MSEVEKKKSSKNNHIWVCLGGGGLVLCPNRKFQALIYTKFILFVLFSVEMTEYGKKRKLGESYVWTEFGPLKRTP